MAQEEPMDVDADFDNKENAFHCNNVLSRTPCTEKGYEELDVSELNMKLRYSITPASSPMSKSFTGPGLDNRNRNAEEHFNIAVASENGNLTRSLNSTLTKTEGLNKSKALPLQTLSVDPSVDSNRNTSIQRLLDPADNNVIISVNANDVDENLSLPSTCSSVPDTPEATTPTKEIPKSEGSPIMRGLKSVLSMFRPSQSPILPGDDKSTKPEILSPIEVKKSEPDSVQISTPITAVKGHANSSKRNSPLKESLVFNDDLATELQWKDETTILFKEERIPVHKLFFQNPITDIPTVSQTFDTKVEHMDISCDEYVAEHDTNANNEPDVRPIENELIVTGESDNEFLDCETTFTKNESSLISSRLSISNETVARNDIDDYPHNSEISKEINSEYNDIPKNIAENTANTTKCIHEALVPVNDSTSQSETNIVEVTKNFLSIERNAYCEIPVRDTHLVKKQLDDKKLPSKDPTAVLIFSEPVTKDDDLLRSIGTQPLSNLNMINVSTSENLQDEEKREYEVSCNNDYFPTIDKAEILHDISDPKDKSNKSLHVYNTNGKNKSVENEIDAIEKINIVREHPVSNNININLETTFNQPNMLNELKSIQLPELESNRNLLINSNHEIFIVDSKMAINNSSNVESTLDADHKINDDVPMINITEGEEHEHKEAGSEIADDNTNLKDTCNTYKNVGIKLNNNHKTLEDIPVLGTEKGKCEMPIVAILPPVKDLNYLPDSTSLLSSSNDGLDATNVNTNSQFLEFNISNNSNDSKIGHIIKTTKEPFLLEISTKQNVESEIHDIKDSHVVANTNSAVNSVSDNNCEQIIVSDMVSKSPSEIPLPDEDDIEQNILRTNDLSKKGGDDTSDGKATIMDVESKLVVDCNKCDQDKIILNPVEETFIVNSFNEQNTEIINNKETDDTKTCSTPSDYIRKTEVTSIDRNSENMGLDRDLQIVKKTIITEENSSKDTSMLESVCKNERQVTQEIKDVIKNSENEIAHEVQINNGDNFSVIATKIVNCETSDDVNKLDKAEHKNHVNVDNNNQDHLAMETDTDHIVEEIITSANNSPYVSVTDLDMTAEKILEDHSEVKCEPTATKTIFSPSPPISPKIISKGYNFNFDDIDDPFATKTKIRISPTPDTLNQCVNKVNNEVRSLQEVPKKVNRRKLQVDKKRSVQKKNATSTISDKLATTFTTENYLHMNTSKDNGLNNISTQIEQEDMSKRKLESDVTIVVQRFKTCEKAQDATDSVTLSTDHVSTSNHSEQTKEEIKCIEQTLVISTEKSTSSEQFYSLGTSSRENGDIMNQSKNVFNLPEIDDVNFNPFATKSKMHKSPPTPRKTISSLEVVNDITKSPIVIQQLSDNNIIKNKDIEFTYNKKIEGKLSPNTSPCSSNHTNDINTTVREIATEDEDTIEGPFLELDDFKNAQKLTDVESETNMMNFEEIPQQEREENLENGELFIDADAFEFLLNQNKSSTVLDSGKESLFLKFDPLFAKRVSSDGILAALSKVQKRQSTPKKIANYTQKDLERPSAGLSNDNENRGFVEECNEDQSSTITKPMMVVNPAVSSSTQKKIATPKLNRRSLTFTSPAMAVIDRLLSLSGNSHLDHDSSIPQVGRDQSETDLALTQLRELLAEKEINVHSLRSESKALKDRLVALEVQVRGLETESAERLAKINELNDRLLEKTKMNKSMAIVVEEYERTIASLIAETEQDKKRNAEERMRLIKERDEQTAHLTSMEVSFSDLHSKYEKSKQIILSCKANEDIYKKSIKEFQENFSKMQNNYELLKQHATSKLNHANQELEKLNRAHEAEVLKMNAMIKRKELHITSLEETLAQKTKANEELTAICDELINKVG